MPTVPYFTNRKKTWVSEDTVTGFEPWTKRYTPTSDSVIYDKRWKGSCGEAIWWASGNCLYHGSWQPAAADLRFRFGWVRSAERRSSSLPLTSIVGLVHFLSGRRPWPVLAPHTTTSTFKCPSPFHFTMTLLSLDMHICYRCFVDKPFIW